MMRKSFTLSVFENLTMKGPSQSDLLSLPELTVDSTGENLFDLLDNALNKHKLAELCGVFS